jgi:hypothetical protein
MSGDRLSNGTFAPGNSGGPGRPRRRTEQEYLAALVEGVSLDDWGAIVKRAVDDAKLGNYRARDWLGKYLVGDDPLSVLELADELAALKMALQDTKDASSNDQQPSPGHLAAPG